jgi:hypothetical protein
MWVELLASHTLFNGKVLPIGTKINLAYGVELIKEGKAREYNGPRPPVEKTKTDFFKPKELDGNINETTSK